MIEFELKYSIPYIPAVIDTLHMTSEKQVLDIYYDTKDYQLLKNGNFIRIRGDSIEFKLNEADDSAHLFSGESKFNKFSFSGDNEKLCILLEKFQFNSSFSNFSKFLEINNLSVLAEINKKRKQYSLDGGVSLMIDDVSTFGYFLEIEKIFPDKKFDAKKEELILKQILVNNNLLPDGSIYVPIGYVEIFLKRYNYEAYKLGKYILPEDR